MTFPQLPQKMNPAVEAKDEIYSLPYFSEKNNFISPRISIKCLSSLEF